MVKTVSNSLFPFLLIFRAKSINLGVNQQILSLSRQLGGYLIQAASLATARNNLNFATRDLVSSLESLIQSRGNQSINPNHDEFLRVAVEFVEFVNSSSFQEAHNRTESLASTFSDFYARDLERHRENLQASLSRPRPSDIIPPPFSRLRTAEWDRPTPVRQVLPFSGQEVSVPGGSLHPETSPDYFSSPAVSRVPSRGASHSSTRSLRSSASNTGMMKTRSQDKA